MLAPVTAPKVPAAPGRPTTPAKAAARAPKVAEPVAVVTFKAEAEIRDRVIRLGDVATIESLDDAVRQTLEAVEVGTAPVSGSARQVSAQFAKVRIRQVGLDPETVLIQGPLLVTVRRPEQILSGAEIEKSVVAAVEAEHPGAVAQVGFPPSDLKLPVGSVEIKPQAPRVLNGASGTVNVQVLVEGQSERTLNVSFRLLRKAPMLVAVRDLTAGTTLTEADVRIEERPVVPGPLVLSDVSQVLGQQVSIPVKGGSPLNASVVKPALVVKRGTRIKLVCKGPSFTITAAGEALQDAVTGQVVRVRNLGSLLEVTGVARGPQTVEIPF